MSAIAVVLSLGSQMAVAAQDADDFVEDASAKGIAEVQVGKLAQDEKGVSADVKEFAKQMVTDHTAANEKLAAGILERKEDGLKSRVRFSSLDDLLLVHSAFPTSDEDSVF
ncbi:DUF4142 domain-containing protein, partial [Pseudomonas syringae]|nr:DUF4142 domain-containing protein [Pseudomonas syringae]